MKKTNKKTAFYYGGAALFFYVVGFGIETATAGTTFGTLTSNIVSGTSGAIQLFNLVAYMAAAIASFAFILALKAMFDNPGQNPPQKAVARACVAAGCGALPTILAAAQGTVSGTTNATFTASEVGAFSGADE